MSAEQTFCLALIGFALCLGALLLREILIDFAALKLRDELDPYRKAFGDWPGPAGDDETLFHDERIAR